MKKLFIGIDNGVSGSIGYIGENKIGFFKTPVKKEQNYTKAKQNITRIDVKELEKQLRLHTKGFELDEIVVSIERPMVNPGRFKATTSALRALEATLVVLELLELPFEYIDSKQWQKIYLPKGIKGSTELKKASLDIGNRMFPMFKDIKHPDRDSLFIADFLRNKYKL